MTTYEETKARRTVNVKLYRLGLTYHNSLPIADIDHILQTSGFTETEPAIYCGRDGHVVEKIGPHSYLSLTWHKMDETGRYEVVAYVSLS